MVQALEDYLWQSSDLLDRLEDMREDLNHNDFADDVAGAKKGMDVHNEVKKKIHKIPVENIDTMGQRLLQREENNSIVFGISAICRELMILIYLLYKTENEKLMLINTCNTKYSSRHGH